MAELKHCKECNGTFLYVTTEQLCLSCSQKSEYEFQTIKSYLRTNPKASVGIVSTALDISVSKIQRYIDEGRLEIIEKEK